MVASFLMAFHSYRIDNVLQTIRLLERNHPDVVADSELILLCQDRIGQIRSGFKNTLTVSLKLPNMQKCRALNAGARQADSDVVIVLDSDRVLAPGHFRQAVEQVGPKKLITAATCLKLSHMVSDDDLVAGRVTGRLETRTVDGGWGLTLFSGNACLMLADYWAAGGMDEDYVGYGFEDNDMSRRVLLAGVQPVLLDDAEVHLYHSPSTYGAGDQKRLFLDNGLRYCRKWQVPVPPQLQAEINAYTKDLL